jgi:hypothetical protein
MVRREIPTNLEKGLAGEEEAWYTGSVLGGRNQQIT